MKNLKINLLIIFIVLMGLSINAQEKGDIIILDVPVSVSNVQSLLPENNKTTNANFLQSGIKFKVISKSDDVVRLQALNFDKVKKRKKGEIDLSEIYNNKIYTISRIDFEGNARKVEPKSKFSIGLLTLPFKTHPQNNFSFDSEYNLNSTINWSFLYYNDVSINWQIGAGIGTVGLDTSNSKGLKNSEAQDVSTITFLSGLMLQYHKIQAGIYIGVDHINNQTHYQWENNGKMWLGFGIGYNLYNLSLAKKTNKQKYKYNQ